jgi:hypothetical protein
MPEVIGYLITGLCAIILLLIGGLFRKVNNLVDTVNDQKVGMVERPTFTQFRQELKELKTEQCKKVTKIEDAFQRHVHEGSVAKVVL